MMVWEGGGDNFLKGLGTCLCVCPHVYMVHASVD